LKEKISLFCDVTREAVIGVPNVSSIYEVPLALAEERLDQIVITYLSLPSGESDLSEWRKMVEAYRAPKVACGSPLSGNM